MSRCERLGTRGARSICVCKFFAPFGLMLVLSVPPLEAQIHWGLDREPVVDDGGKHAFALHGAVKLVAGFRGKAIEFQGPDAYAELAPAKEVAFGHGRSFTIRFALRTEVPGFSTPIMARTGPGTPISWSFIMGREPGRITFEVWSWRTVRPTSRTVIADGRWHRVAGTYDAARNELFLFVDGVLEARARAGEGGVDAATLRLGNNIGADQPFRGAIDELTVEPAVAPEVKDALRWDVFPSDSVRDGMMEAYLESWCPRFVPSRSREAWEVRRAEVRRIVLESLGLWPLPERPPLDVQEGGSLDRGDYTVTRIYWQTWPKVYASGHLYLPGDRKGRLAAVLCPHGHWQRGAFHPVVQARAISLAKLGFVVLTVDSVHRYDDAIGLSPLTIMTWNNIRAIDYLVSRPDVDPERIGSTGASGGGQQTMYLMAVEDRLRAAAPVAMISELRMILSNRESHCRCNHVPGVARVDEPEMCAVFAPRPARYICVTGDWTSEFPMRGWPETQTTWRLYDGLDRASMTQYVSGHDYSKSMREEVYAFFDRVLRGGPERFRIPEPSHEVEAYETLVALDHPPADRRDFQDAAQEMRARLSGVLIKTRSVREALRALVREPEAEARDGELAPEVVARETWRGYAAEKVTLVSEGVLRIPGIFMMPKRTGPPGPTPTTEARGPSPAVVIAHAGGKSALLAGGASPSSGPESPAAAALASLLDAGACVFIIDVRFTGEHGPGRNTPWVSNSLIFGRTEAAMGAHDIRRAVAYLRSRPEVDGTRIAVAAMGEIGPEALLAGILEAGLPVAAGGLDRLYRDGRSIPLFARVLQIGDIPDFVRALAPARLYLGEAHPDVLAAAREACRDSPGRLACGEGDRDLLGWLAGWARGTR